MMADPSSERLIAQYLLGDLTEEQQIEIEDRAFQDKEYLATITTVENDLIDEYVRHELPEADRRKFESRFLASAERRKRVAFAKALAGVAVEAPVVEKASRRVVAPASISWRDSLAAFISGLNPAARFATVAVMLLVLVGGAWLLIETRRLRGQLNSMQAQNQSRQELEQQVEQERRRSEELQAKLNQEKQQREQTDESLRQLTESTETTTPAPRPVIASLTLLPGISRGGSDKPTLALAENARVVRLQVGIEPEEPYKTFAVELRTVAGRAVWNRDNLAVRDRRGARAVGLTLPANVLKPGDYELRLKGITDGGQTEDVGFYYFKVTKK